MTVLDIILLIVYIVVGLALIWFVVELVFMIRKTRNTVTNIEKQIEPTLESVQKITADIEPVTKKIDPLVDRVNLTVDAANLEIMRVDTILEDVSGITQSVSKTLDTVDTVTSAPLDLVTSVTDKVRKKLKTRGASDQSVQLGQSKEKQEVNPVKNLVDTATEAASEAFTEQRDRMQERRAEKKAKEVQEKERDAQLNETVDMLGNTIADTADADAAAGEEKLQNQA